jgi:hypothetical protein
LDKTELVAKDIESGRRLTDALQQSSIPLSASMWFYDPNAAEWWLMIASPMVDTSGSRATYTAIQKVLRGLDPPTDLVFRKISVVSPTEPLIRLLRVAIRSTGSGGVRFTHNTINNHFIEDAYVYLLS